MITDLNMPTKKLEDALYNEMAEREPPLNNQQRSRLRDWVKVNVQSILLAQSFLTAKQDIHAQSRPYGGDIDLFGPALGRSPDVEAS